MRTFLFLNICFLAAALFSPKLFAQTPSKPAPTPAAAPVSANRFLFIIDTSSSMQRHARDVQQLVVDILSSSASGQMHRGDTLGVWTFNADVYTGNIPLQRWLPEEWWQIASHTAEFLQQQHYEKKSRLDRALTDMYEVVTNSDIITIFLISNGESKMHGTPFDDEINASYQQCLKDMKKEKMPVITVLQAKGGKFIKYTVNALPWPVVVPEVPITITKVQPPTAQPPHDAVPQNSTVTNQPNAAIAASTTSPPVTQPSVSKQNPMTRVDKSLPQPPVIPPPSPVIAVQAPVVKPESPPASVPVSPPAMPMPMRQFKPTPSAPVVNANPKPPVPAVVVPSPPLIQPAPVAPIPAQPAAATASALSPKPPQVAQAIPSSNASASPATASPAAQAVAVIPANTAGRPKFFLITAITLVMIALGLIALLVRRARAPSGPSLISSSMDNRRK